MTKEEALALLSSGRSHEWNTYREKNPDWQPDLSNIDLSNIKLVFSPFRQFNLTGTILCGANLSKIDNLVYDQLFADETEAISKGNVLKYINNEFKWAKRTYLNLAEAMFDIFTKFPQDFVPTEHGAVFVSVASTPTTDSVYTVFISYAWTNENVVLAIDQWLRLKGLKTKIDKRDFFAGSRIRDEILRVMQECDAVVIFYSNESKDKPWTQFERELASDLEIEAKKAGRNPPRILYLVLDDTPLPSVTEKNRIAVMAKGKKFEAVCEELYYSILQIAKSTNYIDMNQWSDYTF